MEKSREFDVRVSVCICSFNGEKYIHDQLASILGQLGDLDEVVLCDDGSTDRTVSIVRSFEDIRIRIFVNEINLGHVRNFEKSLSLAKGRYIFLSDQDDIWVNGRVSKMLGLLTNVPNFLLLASNFDLIDEKGLPIGVFRKLGRVHNSKMLQIFSIFSGASPYFGCTFLMTRDILKYCLPIPKGIESHDIWIALIASTMGGVINMEEATLYHRIHGNNATPRKRRSIYIVMKSRIIFFGSLIVRIYKLMRLPFWGC